MDNLNQEMPRAEFILKMKTLAETLCVKNNPELYMDAEFVEARYKNIGCRKKNQIGGQLHANLICINNIPEAIASQYPTKNQIECHLKMLFDMKSVLQTIILNRDEFGSSHIEPYFLPHKIVRCGALLTTSKHRTSLEIENITINVFDMTICEGEKSFDIPILYCDGWEDHGAISPQCCIQLAQFVIKMAEESMGLHIEKRGEDIDNLTKYLPAVHCKAGVGRSGTLLATMAMLGTFNEKLSLEDILVSLRDCRSGEMVQGDMQMDLLMDVAKILDCPLSKNEMSPSTPNIYLVSS